jgi:predicted enzyme related to lactoylglutathione lyase
MKDWYREHLDLPKHENGEVMVRWREDERPERPGTTVVGFFPEDTDYFGDGAPRMMINYRVTSLDRTLARLRAAGATVDDATQDTEIGRFGWSTDPEGNRFELWEPPEGY